VLAAGFFDILDGALARRTNRVTRFGAVLDSTLDRLAEAVILISLLVVYAREAAVAEVTLVSVTLIGSQLVSYVRARAEGIGLQCEVGIFTRAERVVVLALGLLLSQFDYALITVLAIIMVFSYVTVGQRLFYVWQQTKN
jgi:CDP-diacylglycerol--glycerol-3-phosphate 3-phosphatidyltransferase